MTTYERKTGKQLPVVGQPPLAACNWRRCCGGRGCTDESGQTSGRTAFGRLPDCIQPHRVGLWSNYLCIHTIFVAVAYGHVLETEARPDDHKRGAVSLPNQATMIEAVHNVC